MGSWVLEISKMAMYMSFPVAMFHYFNQPEYFEKWVVQKKRELYPPVSKEHHESLEDLKLKMREKHDNELMKALEEIERKEKNY